MSELMAKMFIDKEVRIFPHDTYYKYGILKGVDESSVVFLITKSEDDGYPVGKLVHCPLCKVYFHEV